MTVLEYAYILFMMRRVKRHILLANNLKKNKPRKTSKVYTMDEQPKISTLNSARTHSLTSPIPEHEYLDNGTVKEFLTESRVSQDMSNIGRRIQGIKNHFLEWRSKVRTVLSPLLDDFIDNFQPDDTNLQLLMANTDFVFFWIMIMAFLIFNTIYWTYYTL